MHLPRSPDPPAVCHAGGAGWAPQAHSGRSDRGTGGKQLKMYCMCGALVALQGFRAAVWFCGLNQP